MKGDNGPVKNPCAGLLPLLFIAIIFPMAYTARSQTKSSPAKKSVASQVRDASARTFCRK